MAWEPLSSIKINNIILLLINVITLLILINSQLLESKSKQGENRQK